MRLAIGIPTRNRADLAMTAIASVLRAGVPEVVVVVSDNSTDPGDRDRLEEFCARQPPGTVIYGRPPEPVPMPQNWELLWRRIDDAVAPTHVAYLTDRLVFTAGSLAALAGVVAAHPDHVVSYHFDHVNDVTTPVALVQTPWTGSLLELDTATLARLSASGEFGDYLPRLMTCVAPAGVLRALQARFGNVFGAISPDYRFAYRCLATRDTLLYLDRPCVIEHGMSRSAGISYLAGRMNADAKDFAGRLTVPRFGATPEPAFETVANAIFQEYCSVRDEVGTDRFPPVDRQAYLRANALAAGHIGDAAWREAMRALLRRHGWTRRSGARHTSGQMLAMAGYFARHPGALRRTLKRQLWDRPPGSATARLLDRLGVTAPVRDDLTFPSSAEALAHADAHPRPPAPFAWHVHRLEQARAVVRRHDPPGPLSPGRLRSAA